MPGAQRKYAHGERGEVKTFYNSGVPSSSENPPENSVPPQPARPPSSLGLPQRDEVGGLDQELNPDSPSRQPVALGKSHHLSSLDFLIYKMRNPESLGDSMGDGG